MSELVSIIIPVYNAEKFIRETINSVKNQTYTNWEIILVNDGSRDNSLQLLKSFESEMNNVQVISKDNSGVSETRNLGMSLAKGKYIALLDADDEWLPSNLEKKVSVLEQDTTIDFVFSDMFNVDSDLQNPRLAPVGKDENILFDLLSWNGEVIPGPSSNLVFRKSCLEKKIKFHKSLSTIADQHFTVQLAYYFKGKRIPEALWNYRNVPQSMSKSVSLLEKDAINAYSLYLEQGFFNNGSQTLFCFSKMYWILAGSFWQDANEKWKGVEYILKALCCNPFSFTYLIQKIRH